MSNPLAPFPDLCLRVWQRDTTVLAEIQRLAISQGLQATVQDGQVNIRGRVGTVITLGYDPITAFVTLAIGFVGARWAADPAVGELFEETKKQWKQALWNRSSIRLRTLQQKYSTGQAAKAARERRGKP